MRKRRPAQKVPRALSPHATFVLDFANGVLAFGDTPWFQIWAKRWRYYGEPVTDGLLSAVQDQIKDDLRAIQAGTFRMAPTYVRVSVEYSPEEGVSLDGLNARYDYELTDALAFGLVLLAATVQPKQIQECQVCTGFHLLHDLRKRAQPCPYCQLTDPSIRSTRVAQARARKQKQRAPLRQRAEADSRELVTLLRARATADRLGKVLTVKHRNRIEELEQRQARRQRIRLVTARHNAPTEPTLVQIGGDGSDIRIGLLKPSTTRHKK